MNLNLLKDLSNSNYLDGLIYIPVKQNTNEYVHLSKLSKVLIQNIMFSQLRRDAEVIWVSTCGSVDPTVVEYSGV